MIKGSIQEEDITIINIYTPNIGAPQYVRQMLTSMKGDINTNTIIVGDFNTPLTPMDRSSKQKISKEAQALNDTMDQLDLIDIYRTFEQYMNRELSDVQAGFRKGRGTRDQIANIRWIKKARESQKKHLYLLY